MAKKPAETELTLFDQAVAEVAENGDLSFPTRRKLWLEIGPWEWRDEDDPEEVPRTLTDALRKRSSLALACAKKVMPVWSRHAPKDKAPQKLLKAAADYLSGKIPAEVFEKALFGHGSFIDRAEDDPDSTAPAAAMAAWQAALVPWLDEPLLAERYADAVDGELDYGDWDTAYLASIAWGGRDEEAQPGERAAARCRFWAWYLEQLAPLVGREGYKFPRKAIRAFAEKQLPRKPVPEVITMESFVDFLGAGDYLYHNWSADERTCCITSRMRGDHAVCPKTRQECRKLKFYYGVLLLQETLPDGTMLSLRMWVPLFHCDEHPGDSHTPRSEYGNVKADLKRFFAAGNGQMEALAAELRRRGSNVFLIGEGYTDLNGVTEHHHNVRIPAEVKGIRWVDRKTEILEIDLREFGPHVYFPDCGWKELLRFYPEKAVPQEDGGYLITYQRHWVRCYPNEAGELVRVTITSRFKLEVEWYNPNNQNLNTYNPGKKLAWVKALKTAFDLPTDQARAMVEDLEQPWRERFTNLTRQEAERLQTTLRSQGIKCRIMPWRLDVGGDTSLR